MTIKKETTAYKDKSVVFDNSEKEKIEGVLIENFVSLQKVMTNLAIKFDSLSGQISKLLELFEISAKTLAEKGNLQDENKEDKKVVERLDNLLEQNKIIAKGIALLHENGSQEPQRPMIQQQRQSQQYFAQPIRRVGGIPQPFQVNTSRDPRFNETHR